MVPRQEGYSTERIKQKIKSVKDLAIRIRGFQNKSFQLRTFFSTFIYLFPNSFLKNPENDKKVILGYVLLHHVMGELEGIRGAWGYPEGGMGAVSGAIAKSALAAGAEIYTSTEVRF